MFNENLMLTKTVLSQLVLCLEINHRINRILQFFCSITEHSLSNKMDAYNLAVVIGPSLFPTEEKIAPGAQQRLIKTCELFKVKIIIFNKVSDIKT